MKSVAPGSEAIARSDAFPPLAGAEGVAHGWRRGITDLPREHGFERLAVAGTVPQELRGTLYRNGPGLLSGSGRRYAHWFDGDGVVSAVRLRGNCVEGAARVVRSVGLERERRAGRALYGGFSGRSPRPIREFLLRQTKNPANTNVLAWQGRLFALCEIGRPTEIAADSLTTLGEASLGGLISRAFSAHPRASVVRRTTYGFGVRLGFRSRLDVFALPERGPGRRLTSIPLAAPTMIHDFAATDRHLVFFVPPLELHVLPLLLGHGSFSDNLVWNPKRGTEVIVVPIDAPERIVRFSVDPFFQFHFVNAFERRDEIVVDAITYPDYRINEWLGQLVSKIPDHETDGRLERIVVDRSKRTLRRERRWSRSCEFPRVSPCVDGAEYRYAYVSAHSAEPGTQRGLQDRLAKIDMTTGRAQEVILDPGQYPSEPIFVPRPGGTAEDDGWLLTMIYDARRHASYLSILDARDPGTAPLAKIHFDHHIPFTFHGSWVPVGP